MAAVNLAIASGSDRLRGDVDPLLESPQPIQRSDGVVEEIGGVLELRAVVGPQKSSRNAAGST